MDESDGPAPAEDRAEDEALAKVRSYVGPDADDPIQTYFDLGLLSALHREGNPYAPLYCLILCDQRNAKVPQWAVHALARAFHDHLCTGMNLQPALLRNQRGGQMANPGTRFHQRWGVQKLVEAVGWATFFGYRGDRVGGKYEHARIFLEQFGVRGYTEDSIKQIYYAWRGRKRKHGRVDGSDLVIDLLGRMELPVPPKPKPKKPRK